MPPRKPSYPSSGAVSVVPSPHDSANLNLTPSIPMSHYRHHHQQHQQQLQQQQQHAGSNQLPRPVGGSSRTRASGSGEIVEVQGGHIVRSMGRKDRHSKVCTSKGPRDRRVRLSAHTAIQFYDVQDRLGYDRPSKAVDWLIRNAKAAIDELAELPPWQPTTVTANTANPSTATVTNATTVNHDVVSSKNAAVTVSPTAPPTASYNYASSDLLPPSLESDAIADTIKFFFPAATTVAAPSSSSSGYPPDLLSRASNLTQDLRLSLQSFHDPVLIHSHSPNSAPLAFGAGQNPTVVHWNPGGGSGETFDLAAVQQQPPAAAAVQLPHAVPLHQLLVQGTAMTQRGPLQSNSPQSFRARIDPTVAIQHAELSGFASGAFPGFCIPARIHGEDEHVAGALGKPPSSTPPSSSRR